MISNTSETEILAEAMYESLDPFVVTRLPNIFRDKSFTDNLRQALASR